MESAGRVVAFHRNDGFIDGWVVVVVVDVNVFVDGTNEARVQRPWRVQFFRPSHTFQRTNLSGIDFRPFLARIANNKVIAFVLQHFTILFCN
jgi:hypothetical protein